MKTCLPITILLALVLATSVSAAQVGSIRLAYENGATVARIDVQGPFQFTHTTEVPKDGKPDRLIVDIVGASHTWGPKEWASLPQCSVTKLRIGQYSSKPEKVVRVVFELTKAPVYQADSDGKTITIRLTDASAKQFAAWSTGPAPTTAPVVPATATAPAPSVKPNPAPQTSTPAVAIAPKVENKPAAQPTSHSTMAQQQPVTSKPTTPAAPASKPAATTTPAAKPAPVVASNDNKPATPASSTPASKPTTVAPKVESKPAPTVAATNTTTTPSTTSAPATKPATVAPKVESKPAPTVASAPAKPVTTPSQPASKPAEVAPKVESKPAPVVASQPASQPTTTPAVKPAVTPETKPASPVVAQSTPKVEAKSTTPEVKPAIPATSAKPDQLAKAEQFKGPVTAPVTPAEKTAPQTPAVKPATPAVASTSNEAVANKPADVKPADAQQEKPASADTKVPAPDKPVFAEADDATGVSTPARQTARFRRSATASSRMKSSLVAEFPQRLVIKYENMGYRDPFATLIDDTRTYDTPIEKRLANVEGLRLVGILENASGDNRALFQDKRNFSYMLKAGDKVEKGYVLRVEADKVYFQIFEYGWSRTVALTFDNRD